jgi:hypothetical protein
VFAKLQPRRPPLFSFVRKVPTVSESPSSAPTAAHTPLPHSSGSQETCSNHVGSGSHPTHASCFLASRLHSLPLFSFHVLTNCKFCNSFVFRFIQNAGGCCRGRCAFSTLGRSDRRTFSNVSSTYPLSFHTLAHSLRHGRDATLLESIRCALFSSRRGCVPPGCALTPYPAPLSPYSTLLFLLSSRLAPRRRHEL